MPDYLISRSTKHTILRNFEGVIASYAEPENYKETCKCDVCAGKDKIDLIGIAGLEQGHEIALEPKGLARAERSKAAGNK